MPLVEIYLPLEDRWEDGPPLPIALNRAMSAVADGTVIVAGGFQGPGLTNPSDRVFACPMVSAGWRWPPSPSHGRREAWRRWAPRWSSSRRVGSNRLIETTAVWDPEVAVWEEVAGLITPASTSGSPRQRAEVYAVGGRTTGLGNLASFEVFDLSLMDWERLPDLPTPRGGLAASAIGALVIAVGGEEQATFEEVEAYHVVSGEWVSLPALPTARHGLAAVAWEGILFVLSGGTEPGYSFSAANEALTVGTG